jgi:glycosyltransferase involved in cell wall biosynthesis
VVHVSQPVEAGVAGVVADLLLEQHEAGLEVHLVSPPGPLAERSEAAGVPWSRWEATREPGPSVLSEAAALRRVLAALRPDVVHLHSSKAGLAGRLALRGRVPTAFQPHAWSFAAATRPQRRGALAWERFAGRWTDLLLCCSPEEEQEGRAAGVRGRSLVVPNGVDLQRFSMAQPPARAALRDRLDLQRDVPVAVCVGRLSRQKGQDVAVRAWQEVRRALPEAVLLLVGDGPERARLEQDAGEGVRLLGQRDDVPDLVGAADLALLPSRWEGLALALLEAMASGRCVVTTDVAGSRSTLLGGDLPAAGAVVAVDDPTVLARAVVARLTDTSRSAAEGLAGRRRVERDHDLRDTTARVRAAYGDLRPSG